MSSQAIESVHRLASEEQTDYIFSRSKSQMVLRMQKMAPKEPIGILPIICLLLPFLLCVPYHWFIFDSAASGHIVTLQLDEDHRRAHLGVFWTLTYGPFAIISLLTALILLIRRARRNRHRGSPDSPTQ